MYLAIDIGGTKTLVATLTNDGVISEKLRFETPKDYSEFVKQLADTVANISTDNFLACGVAMPGKVDRKRGVGIVFGNLSWKNVPLKADIEKMVPCPVIIENDANLAGLSEAMLVKHKYNRVLYLTISTGIGSGVITNQTIDPSFADSEVGHMMLEHNERIRKWQDFASGRAIVKQYGKKAKDITDEATWRRISYDLAIGMTDLISMMQPEVIILGGSVGHYSERYRKSLVEILKRYETPLTPVPPIIEAKRPDDAVLYGCYDLAKSLYGKTRP